MAMENGLAECSGCIPVELPLTARFTGFDVEDLVGIGLASSYYLEYNMKYCSPLHAYGEHGFSLLLKVLITCFRDSCTRRAVAARLVTSSP